MQSFISGRTTGAAGTESKKMFFGIYLASVISTQDPERLGRVTLSVPQVLGSATSNWADMVNDGNDIPGIGAIIYAMFVGGDVNKPVYFN